MVKVGLAQLDNSFPGQCYLPYAAGLLQAYVLEHADEPGRYEFKCPLFRRASVSELVAHLEVVDVAAFSVSMWNFRLCLSVAQELKRRRPEIWIVFGGPQVPRQPAKLLEENPCLDVVCSGEGERIFLEMLEMYPNRDFNRLSGCGFRHKNGPGQVNPSQERIANLEEIPSPYLSGVFEPLVLAYPDVKWQGLMETNRGCPFGCTYCDWGKGETRQVYRFSLERVRAEMEWFARHGVEFVFCCDANFGLLRRDVEIATLASETKAKYGYPHVFSVQFTKNASHRAFKTQLILSDAGLDKGANIAFQTLYPPALASVGRKNISLTEFERLQSSFREVGVTTFSDLILGLPGETAESFRQGVETLIRLGQHNRIQFNNLVVMPNAPMADPDYRTRHGLITVETRIVYGHGFAEQAGVEEVAETQEMVVGTATMPPAAWARTRAFAWMVNLLYFDKLLQIPLLFLNRTSEIEICKMVNAFCGPAADEFPQLCEIRDFLTSKAQAILTGGEEYCRSEKWLNIWWPADELMFIELVARDLLDEFYDQARNLLRQTLLLHGVKPPAELKDALALNKMLVRRPFAYQDDIVELGSNMGEFYRTALSGKRMILQRGRHHYHILCSEETWEGWDRWCREVVWYRHKAADYLYAFEAKDHENSSHQYYLSQQTGELCSQD